MMNKDERTRRWAGTARTTRAGALLGAVGGALSGSLALLGDEVFTTGGALAVGVAYGAHFGALIGAVLGTISGALGGCLAVHLVRRHERVARVVLVLCAAVLTTAMAAWSLPVPHLPVWAGLAGVLAAAAAWYSASWCLRPLLSRDGLAS